jgi:ribosomal protein L11 methyltransferase
MAWERVTLVVAGFDVPSVVEKLEESGAVSVEVADADAGAAGERAVFAEPGAEAALWPRCRVVALFAEGTAPGISGASIDRLADADWVRETRRQFEPFQASERIWIVPTWHAPPDPRAINLVLDPGAAFGTGSHPTTRLVLRWLEQHVDPGSTVLDYGCGSGILGIAALKLGARAATGVDIDPLALEAARYNARRNDVPLVVVSADKPLEFRARLSVANILANPLRMLAPVIARHTETGGWIALSGVLDAQAKEVAAAYAPWARLEVLARDEAWVLLAGERGPTTC